MYPVSLSVVMLSSACVIAACSQCDNLPRGTSIPDDVSPILSSILDALGALSISAVATSALESWTSPTTPVVTPINELSASLSGSRFSNATISSENTPPSSSKGTSGAESTKGSTTTNTGGNSDFASSTASPSSSSTTVSLEQSTLSSFTIITISTGVSSPAEISLPPSSTNLNETSILVGTPSPFAASGDSPSFTPSSPLSSWTTHVVEVGMLGQTLFDPEQVAANVGDTIQFNMHNGNHSITESSFEEPCAQLANGFDSGFPRALGLAAPVVGFVSLKVDLDTPRWFHCRQVEPSSHCRRGMVFAVNPRAQMNAFLDNARLPQPSVASAAKADSSTGALTTSQSASSSSVENSFSISTSTIVEVANVAGGKTTTGEQGVASNSRVLPLTDQQKGKSTSASDGTIIGTPTSDASCIILVGLGIASVMTLWAALIL